MKPTAHLCQKQRLSPHRYLLTFQAAATRAYPAQQAETQVTVQYYRLQTAMVISLQCSSMLIPKRTKLDFGFILTQQ